MKCDQCDNDATVHEVTVRNGVKIEKHLCESCAGQQGISVQSQASLPEMLKNYMAQALNPTLGPQAVKGQVCPTCRTTFQEFKQQGLMGCPDCYRAFEAPLTPLLERAHGGGARHTGKSPKRQAIGKSADEARAAMIRQLEERARRLQSLRAELDSAVKAEQYERAAQLRDELKRLSDSPSGGIAGNA